MNCVIYLFISALYCHVVILAVADFQVQYFYETQSSYPPSIFIKKCFLFNHTVALDGITYFEELAPLIAEAFAALFGDSPSPPQ